MSLAGCVLGLQRGRENLVGRGSYPQGYRWGDRLQRNQWNKDMMCTRTVYKESQGHNMKVYDLGGEQEMQRKYPASSRCCWCTWGDRRAPEGKERLEEPGSSSYSGAGGVWKMAKRELLLKCKKFDKHLMLTLESLMQIQQQKAKLQQAWLSSEGAATSGITENFKNHEQQRKNKLEKSWECEVKGRSSLLSL